ncbi:HAMP domain-containing histidine kinase [Microaerobacter geothermalis]|uniref:sensor histidine kinase n=1 Tax=Microaerobacter geothermalis TaxID=674972 RepID=UPI001F15EF77|nr:HAMP domain-containing sensor histidine kinase [Microaerobacter geothermalis]MCF6093072.1 HAMP domain-containing histidine kinase [Microaerobacter geothermalis]
MSIRFRLTLWYTSVLAITFILIGTSLYFFLVHNLTKDLDRRLVAKAQEVYQSIEVVVDFPFPLKQLVLPELNVFVSPDIYLQAVNHKGEVVARSRNLGSQTLPLSANTLKNTGKGEGYIETVQVSSYRFRIYSLPLIVNNNVIGILQVGGSMAALERSFEQIKLLLWLSGLMSILLASGLGWILAQKALRPIENVIKEVSEIEEGKDLKRRLTYHGPRDEVGHLIMTFNGMLARIQSVYQALEESYRSQRRFVSDASHELRTPLTTIRGNVEFLQKMNHSEPVIQEVLQDIREEAEHMSRLINDLLSLARADAGFEMEKTWLLLDDWIQDVIKKVEGLPRNVPFHVDKLEVLKDAAIWGNGDYLRQLMVILLENAFKYTKEGYVKLRVEKKENQIGFHVEDTGIGIEEKDIPHLFNRFFRADPARNRTGTGLGLAIAKWIVDEHQGRIEVKSEWGKGSTFSVWFSLHEE